VTTVGTTATPITWPAALPQHARLGVWAPSCPGPVVFPRRFGRGLAALRAAGYTVTAGKSCDAALGAGTLAPNALAAELHELLDECDGVVAAVGGWTLTSVLPHIDWDRVGRAAKPIIGYSDITSLLNLTARRAGLVAFHGPMVISEWGEADGPWLHTGAEFTAVLADEHWTSHRVPPATEWSDENLFWDRDDTRRQRGNSGDQPVRSLRAGLAEGPLWGGSLVVLGLLLGTPLWPEPEPGSIVVIEVDGIAPDELWARLTQFRLAGVFDRASAVVVGKIGKPGRCPSGFADFDEVIRACVPTPVAAGFDIGHTEPMATLPIGGRARLTCPDSAAPELVLLREEGQCWRDGASRRE
jgi:muramoyltetrapeptide carboxypeptidase